jgi:uncharacterized protein (TIGR03032 family)
MPGTMTPPPEAPKFQYAHSPGFPVPLEQPGISLAVTTYQAGKLMPVRAEQGLLSTLLRSFEQPMGLALSERLDRLIAGTRRMVWTLASAPGLAPQIGPPGRHDACFVPRTAHVTGDIRGHELALVGGRIWIATLCSRASARSTTRAMASCRAGARPSSIGWSPRIAAT